MDVCEWQKKKKLLNNRYPFDEKSICPGFWVLLLVKTIGARQDRNIPEAPKVLSGMDNIQQITDAVQKGLWLIV